MKKYSEVGSAGGVKRKYGISSHFMKLCEETPLVAIQGYDEEGYIFFWNRASEHLYGYGVQEVLSKNIKEILLEHKDWERFDVEVKNIIKSGKPTSPQQWKVKTRDGSFKDLLSTMIPVVVKGKNYVYCMDVDITEQVSLYDKLVEKENLYRTIVEGAHEGIWVVDENFTTVFVNPQIAKILGYELFCMIGKTTLEFVPEEEQEDVLLRRENRRKGLFEQYERTLICADGTRKTFLVNATPLMSKENEFKGAVGFFTDITERKRLEKLVEIERNMLKEYLNLSPSIFLVMDGNGDIVFANRIVEELLCGEGTVVNRNWIRDFVSPRHKESVMELFQLMIRGEEIQERNYEIDVVTSNGEERVFSLRCARLKDDSIRGVRIICAGLDITEQKRVEKEREILEEKIKQTQRLESIGVLAGSIAHDFNNLLVGIVGNTDLAMMELPQEHPAQRYLSEVIKISKKLTHISNQLLAYAGKAKTCVREISITELIRSMETLIELSVLNKKIGLKYDLQEDLPLISADPLYVQQLIIDLITNSAEAIGERTGTITIVTRSMFCDRRYLENTYFGQDISEGRYVYIEVTDTGPGIPEDVKHRMFEPFYTTKSFGRGLGLSAVAGIVKTHKGA
ncbi:MAG: PAS domain S-box protein, partial [Candidatus Hydrogenedentes bacterium]|nr:PAS domain S-box protein [Candidatus Hydrogenedentota bacterium]